MIRIDTVFYIFDRLIITLFYKKEIFSENPFYPSHLCSKEREAEYLNSQFRLCYIYDMFNFENKEFTITGYTAINNDIKKIISCGFKYIMVSNSIFQLNLAQ